jgi:regulatory protein
MNKEILRKAASFCAYQERTHDEVRKRLSDWGVWGDDAEEMIAYLISENFLNEQRFAEIFAGSKFRQKQWGKVKIKYELRQRGLSAYNVAYGLSCIDNDDYLQTLEQVIDKKKQELRAEPTYTQHQKAARYAIGKGFEPSLVWEVLNALDNK